MHRLVTLSLVLSALLALAIPLEASAQPSTATTAPTVSAADEVEPREDAFLIHIGSALAPLASLGNVFYFDVEYQSAFGDRMAVVVQAAALVLFPHFEGGGGGGGALLGGVRSSWGDGPLDGFYLKALAGAFVLDYGIGVLGDPAYAEDPVVGGPVLFGGLGYQWVLDNGFSAQLGLSLGLAAGFESGQEPVVVPSGQFDARLGYAF